MVFWHPRGFLLYQVLENQLRQLVRDQGYHEVRSPQVLSQRIWESSGHWQSFREEMLVVNDGDRAFALKPVSCPGHIEIVRRMAPSYRDLPIRLAEFGLVHRNERSGSLNGLFRLRQFSQDDGHVFCSEDQIDDEIDRFCRSLRAFYGELGFADLDVSFSGRPDQSEGVDSQWERAEKVLEGAALKSGLDFHPQPGQGAFYGPKLDFSLKDRLGRLWQCGTIQLDHVLPERFDIHYVGSGGDRRKPVVLHRALFGSLERFIGILLEHYRGALPAWLAPEQVLLAPVGSRRRVCGKRSAAAISRQPSGSDRLPAGLAGPKGRRSVRAGDSVRGGSGSAGAGSGLSSNQGAEWKTARSPAGCGDRRARRCVLESVIRYAAA